ncbi:MAG: hypothetical protein LBG27_12220 [Spirochaetaceae bacterium]|jgi:hypothetical protein|nr:hypothetical protein [Spirochaetaceae bacterium]
MERKLVLEKAIADAVTYSSRHGILKDFFETLLPEEVNMLATEWNLDDAVQVAREEGWEKGREEDRELVFDIIRQANSMDDLKKMLEMSFSGQGRA